MRLRVRVRVRVGLDSDFVIGIAHLVVVVMSPL